jgi:hypothetical protein
MPNYRLTFQITGTTVPAVAGYYGADEQSLTQWKRAGGGAYIWKTGSTFYMGETVGTNTARFTAAALDGTWTATGGGTGTPVYSEYTIAESWSDAENTVFSSLKTWLGGTEERDCFRGYLPVNEDGNYKYANIWMLSSGGNAGAFDIQRTYGENGAWCNALINAELVGTFENRITAMHFAGAVMAWLKSTGNLSQTANVNWCHLRALPDAPTEQIILGRRYWIVRIQLEILYITEGVYA